MSNLSKEEHERLREPNSNNDNKQNLCSAFNHHLNHNHQQEHVKTPKQEMQSARKQKKKRAVRQNSNVFAFFDQKQIAEFKEAFNMFDHDSDGFVDKEDLKDMLASLGEYLDEFLGVSHKN
jgi:type III secretory pathway component EscR